MPILVISEERRQLEIRRAERAEELDRRHQRDLRWILVSIVGWNLVGLILMGLAMASTSQERGNQLGAAGLLLGYGGMLITLFFQGLRLLDRGGG